MRREWTVEEETYLEKWYEKKGVSYLAKRLKRTNNSVKRKAQSMGYNAYACERLYVKTLAACFQVDSRVVNRWIDKCGLKSYTVIRGQARCRLIAQKDFWDWALENKDEVPWQKYTVGTVLPEPSWVKEQVRNYIYKNDRKAISDYDKLSVISLRRKGLTFPQISKETGRTLNSVKHIWRNHLKEKEK